MKITINEQILEGNFPDGFKTGAWMEALEAVYRKIATAWFPDAEIIVEFNTQNASGYSRPVDVFFDDDDDVSAVDQQSMTAQIENAPGTLDDQDFYD